MESVGKIQSEPSLSLSLLFISVLLLQEVYSVDFVFRDNGTLNWLVGIKMEVCCSLREECSLLSETLKGLKGDVTVVFRRTM